MNNRLEINCNYKYKTRLLAAAAKKHFGILAFVSSIEHP